MLAQCPCSGGDAEAGPLVLFGLVACAVWLVYGIARKDGVSRMSKIWKIALVVALVAAVAIVIIHKQRGPSPVTDKTEPGTEVTAQTAQPVAGLPRLVELGSKSCIPCKMMAPILEELKKEYAGRLQVDFIDVWENPDAGKRYGIRVIPTQVFFDASGQETFRHEGFFPQDEIEKQLAQMGVK